MTDMFVFYIFARWATISIMRPPPLHDLITKNPGHQVGVASNFGCTFMSRNKQSRKYLCGSSYKNDKFDWPFDLVIVTL